MQTRPVKRIGLVLACWPVDGGSGIYTTCHVARKIYSTANVPMISYAIHCERDVWKINQGPTLSIVGNLFFMDDAPSLLSL